MDLREVVVAALDRSPSADPNVVAAEVAKSIPSHQVRAALAQALPQFVMAVSTSRRSRTLAPVPSDSDEVGSRRWKAAASILMLREWTGVEWKLMRDFTADECLAAAAHKRRHAAGVIARAERLEALAALMVERKASTVADLSEDDAAEVLAA